MPRELSDTHSIGVTLAGWMSHARDKKFSEVYVDRDHRHWTEAPITRRAAILGASVSMGELNWTQTDGWQVAFPNQALPAQTQTELWYSMPEGLTASAVSYVGTTNGTLSGYQVRWGATDTADASTGEFYGQTFNGLINTATLTTARRYLYAQVASAGSAITPTAGTHRSLSSLAVYGSHGLSGHADQDGYSGFYVSDILRDITSRFCPQLDTSGIQDTSYVVSQVAFLDRTFPYDAFLELNKYHLWHLGVWENKRLDFRPYDLTDYDWEIRTDDPGTTFSPQGPSTESLFNGITVQYQDILTGTTNVLTPETNPELADTSSTNPWNQHGVDHWDEITLSTPDTETGALYLGAAALADRNAPKTPGTITVRGYIRDRAGNDQPAWKPRAGETISITNFPNDTPRLIVETDYNDEDKTLRIAVDRPFQLLEAYFDRTNTALGARGLA
jgi:hypothetical protein